MDLKFEVFAYIARGVDEVFEAIADPAQLSAYFTTGGAEGRLQPGATVSWDFHDFPGRCPVEVIEVVADTRIVLTWDANEGGEKAGYKTRVTIALAPVDGGARTKVTIAEEGWRDNQAALDASYGNCMGWAQMLAALKVWVEHGIRLREGMYK
ncbi:MAG: SRPBCC domain-containing protein [Novosphingobium sp.]